MAAARQKPAGYALDERVLNVYTALGNRLDSAVVVDVNVLVMGEME